jgi:hypothetical protein
MNRHWMDRTLRVRLPIIAAVAVIAYAVTFWVSKPEREQVGYAPAQPIPFSHKLHAGDLQLDCRMCHVGVEKGAQATLPGLNVCMNCHSQVATDKPAIQLLKKHHDSGEPFFWKRVHRLPEYVYFDHSVHITKGFDCSQCHGKVNEMDTVKKVHAQTMASCLECHKGVHETQPGLDSAAKGPTNCSACHR